MILVEELSLDINKIPFVFKTMFEEVPEEDIWVGRCLEMNLVVTAPTFEEAQSDLHDVIETQVDYCMVNENMEHMFHSAPQEEWDKFYDAHNCLPRCQCGEIMKGSNGCRIPVTSINGLIVPRIPYGYETRSNDGPWSGKPMRGQYHLTSEDRCHDCDTPLGKWHHFGCDFEECPSCGGQMLTCGCNYD